MFPFNLDPALALTGLLLALMLASVRPAPPPPQVVVVQPPPPEAPAEGALMGLIIFGLLVLLLAGVAG